MRTLATLLLAATVLSGCAKISAIPLDPKTLARDESKAEGIRYYIPKPYLLVVALPAAPPASSSDSQTSQGSGSRSGSTSAGGHSTAGSSSDSSTGSNTGKSDKPSDTGSPQASTPAAAAGDTSFAAAMSQYSMKLVYLPDFDQPMAIQVQAGLFGTASLTPSLQDGWMLSSLSGNVDSGGANAMQTLQSVLSAVGGGPSTAAKVASRSANTSSSSLQTADGCEKLGEEIGVNSDNKTLLSIATEGSSKCGSTYLGSLVAGIAKGANQSGQRDAFATTILPPGLYEIDSRGTQTGFRAVMYFCSTGPQTSPCQKESPERPPSSNVNDGAHAGTAPPETDTAPPR